MKKKVKIRIPAPHKVKDVVISKATAALTKPAGPVRCNLVVRDSFWSGAEYVVIAPEAGQSFPSTLKSGQLVDVTFLPPK